MPKQGRRKTWEQFVCPNCGVTFEAYPSRTRVFCSRACLGESRRNTIEQLYANIDTSGGPDACWPWLGAGDKDGYGQTRWNMATRRVARIVWEHAHGEPLPEGLYACHTCDNPPCCNPAHLFLGSSSDNQYDYLEKKKAGQYPAYINGIKLISPTVNSLCAKCTESCKQDAGAVVLACPHFQTAGGKTTKEMPRRRPQMPQERVRTFDSRNSVLALF
jgi:hypothetical protein